jgi:hypothetical protein
MEMKKYYDDSCLSSKLYSLISGIEMDELLKLELEFLSKIKWNINIEEEKFYNYSKKLETCFYSPMYSL